MLVSCVYIGNGRDAEFSFKGFEFVCLSNVDKNTVLNIVLAIDIVAKVVRIIWDNDNVAEDI